MALPNPILLRQLGQFIPQYLQGYTVDFFLGAREEEKGTRDDLSVDLAWTVQS